MKDWKKKGHILHKVMFVLLMLCATVASAQEISVASFHLLENDLTANTHATMMKDRNGEVSALIKVVTTEQGFVFDGGMVGIVKTVQEAGEIWVYVPHGIKRLSIRHPQFGVLRDYYFPVAVEKARTYEMVLSTPQTDATTTIENHENSIRGNYFLLRPDHPKASVYIDGEPYLKKKDGTVSGMLPYGEHSYRVEAVGYKTEEGIFNIGLDQIDLPIHMTVNRPQAKWYIQGQLGTQYTAGEINISHLISPNTQLSVGYNFNAIWGARLTINGWESKAGRLTNNDVLNKWTWNYVAPVVDGTVNLSNWIGGYKPKRLISFGLIVGIGANIAFNNDEAIIANEQIKAEYNFTNREALRGLWDGTKAHFTARIGINTDFRINDNFCVSFEVQHHAINDYYNSKRSGNFDSYINALLGVKYIFKPNRKILQRKES